MEMLATEYASAWLADHSYADSEANRVGCELWRTAAADGIDHEDSTVRGALSEMRFTFTDDNGDTQRVDALASLHAAFVRGSNPYEHRLALANLGVVTLDDERDGDYPDVGLQDTTTVPDDEAAALGLDVEQTGTTVAGVTAPDGAGTTVQTPPYDGTTAAPTAGEQDTKYDDDDTLPAFPDTADALLVWNDDEGTDPRTGTLWFVNPAGGRVALPVTTGEHRDEDDGHGNRRSVWHVDIDHETAHAFTHPSVRVAGAFHTHNPQRWRLVESLDVDTMNGMDAGATPGPEH